MGIVNRVAMFTVLLIVAISTGVNLGCDGKTGLEKVNVSGAVTFHGTPLEEGQIRFVPIEGTKGPASVAYIRQGQYEVVARGGVQVGTHRVEILAFKSVPNAKPYTEEEADGEFGIKAGDIPTRQVMPAKYNTQSTLQVTIESGSNNITRDFDLE